MQVKVTRAFRAVAPGEVYPSVFLPGMLVEGRLAEIACEMKCADAPVVSADQFTILKPVSSYLDPLLIVTAGGEVAANDASAEGQTPPPPSTTRARLKKAYAGPDETGTPCKIAKGGVVEGAFADALIASGFATAI